MYVLMYVFTYGCMYVPTYVQLYIHTYIYAYVCIYACMYVCMHACMHARMHSVCMNVFSQQHILKGRMPEGTWLGPLTFTVFINDMMVQCPCHKFIDNVTLREILKNEALP